MKHKLFTAFQKFYIPVLVLIHAAWFIQALYFRNFFYPDSIEYILQADNLVQHGSLYTGHWEIWPHAQYLYTLRPPLYAVFILLTHGITGSWVFLLVVQNLLSILNFIWLRKIIVSLLPSRSVSLFIILGLLFFPVHFVHVNTVMSEVLFQFFLVAALANAVKFFKGSDAKCFLYMVLFIAAGLFTKAVLLYLWVPVAIMAVWYFAKRKKLSYLVAGGILPLLIVIQCTYNRHETGYYHYTSIQLFNRIHHNVKELLIKEKGLLYADSVCNTVWRKSFTYPDLRTQYAYIEEFCSQQIKTYPVQYGLYHVKGMLPVFLAPGRDELHFFYGVAENNTSVNLLREINAKGISGGLRSYLGVIHPAYAASILLMVAWNVILLAGSLFTVFQRKIPLGVRVVLFVGICYIAFASSLTIGSARFRIPFYPYLIAAALAGFDLLRKIYESRFRKASLS